MSLLVIKIRFCSVPVGFHLHDLIRDFLKTSWGLKGFLFWCWSLSQSFKLFALSFYSLGVTSLNHSFVCFRKLFFFFPFPGYSVRSIIRYNSRTVQCEEEMATYSSILAWEIPWLEEPGGLQSMESPRVIHDWVCVHACARTCTHTHSHTHIHWLHLTLITSLKTLSSNTVNSKVPGVTPSTFDFKVDVMPSLTPCKYFSFAAYIVLNAYSRRFCRYLEKERSLTLHGFGMLF